jgi:hypothetical protein
VRFDSLGGAAIKVRNGNIFSNCKFSLDNFSFDNQAGAGAAGGWLLDLNLANCTAGKGAACLSNGRIEANALVTASHKSIVRIAHPAAATDSYVNLSFENLSVESGGGPDNLLVSTDYSTLGMTFLNVLCYNMYSVFDNDGHTAHSIPCGKTITSIFDCFSTLRQDTDSPGRIRWSGFQGIRRSTYDSDANFTGFGREGDVFENRKPRNASGRSGRCFARKAVQTNAGFHNIASGASVGSGSITSGTNQLVLATIPGTIGAGYSVDVPGAGAAGATLTARIDSVNFSTKTLTLNTTAGTTVASAAVVYTKAEVMNVPMEWASGSYPTDNTIQYQVGDVAFNGGPTTANPVVRRICITANTKGTDVGTWRPVSSLTGKGSTGTRPTLNANDVGVCFMDTTLAAAGKPIWWNGANWVDATGATV